MTPEYLLLFDGAKLHESVPRSSSVLKDWHHHAGKQNCVLTVKVRDWQNPLWMLGLLNRPKVYVRWDHMNCFLQVTTSAAAAETWIADTLDPLAVSIAKQFDRMLRHHFWQQYGMFEEAQDFWVKTGTQVQKPEQDFNEMSLSMLHRDVIVTRSAASWLKILKMDYCSSLADALLASRYTLMLAPIVKEVSDGRAS